MKLKKVLALGLVAGMMTSMAIGVSATGAGSQSIRIAKSGTETPGPGEATVAVEGIIEPTVMDQDTTLLPTDPSTTSDVSSGWKDPIVYNTSQLLVTAPARMKFVVSGHGTGVTAADLLGESVSGNIKNASAYIYAPEPSGYVQDPDAKKVLVKAKNAVPATARRDFYLAPNSMDDNQLANTLTSTLKGAVRGVGLTLENSSESYSVIDYATISDTASVELGQLVKGYNNSSRGINPSNTTIKFVENPGTHGVKTAFAGDVDGRLTNDYNLILTFEYLGNS